MSTDSLLNLFQEIGEAIESDLADLDDWGKADGHPGQYKHDVVANSIAVPMLEGAGLGVISEESEPVGLDRPLIAVIDPIDGSTNASLGLPWYALSICVVNQEGAVLSSVRNLATSVSYSAERGAGAERDGSKISASTVENVGDAIVVFNDLPPHHLGWKQYRTMGSAALDLCCIADGTFDGFIDFGSGLAIWDYAGAALICEEANAMITTSTNNQIGFSSFHSDFVSRSRIIASGSTALHDTLLEFGST
ncbi:MAG: inositol monophosphatase [Acidimicrobiales bacterium]|jgi:fructose-1,6-bisphosphatase/inositol monophosphatase family enzyme|nr:inositol monophosphatase [Acidimicrobiales bacterium]MDP6298469.1 inositol monophosphatase [Acidimicrobiales bacterium]HJM28194.1 inositol monophosphatase [Acidimicrobiales bacterium]HJM97171.1 inositol monophosphatase [Acidimicrobiales bacterium]